MSWLEIWAMMEVILTWIGLGICAVAFAILISYIICKLLSDKIRRRK